MSYALTGAAPFVNHGGSSTGWTAGAGVDYAFTESVFGRIEYRYTSFATSGFVSVATNSAEAPIACRSTIYARASRTSLAAVHSSASIECA